MAGPKPQYRLCALNKRTGQKSQNLGAAWINDIGSISLTLNLCVVMQSDPDMVYTLFPTEFGTNPLSEKIAIGEVTLESVVKERPKYTGTLKSEVFNVACPECDAEVGMPCLSVQNEPRKSFHSARWNAHAKMKKENP